MNRRVLDVLNVLNHDVAGFVDLPDALAVRISAWVAVDRRATAKERSMELQICLRDRGAGRRKRMRKTRASTSSAGEAQGDTVSANAGPVARALNTR